MRMASFTSREFFIALLLFLLCDHLLFDLED